MNRRDGHGLSVAGQLDDGEGGGEGVMVAELVLVFEGLGEVALGLALRRRRCERWVWFFETQKATEPFEGLAHLGVMSYGWRWSEQWLQWVGFERRNGGWRRRRRRRRRRRNYI